MSFLLLGLGLVVASIASMLDANRISTRLRMPGTFDLMGPDRYLFAIGAVLLILGLALAYQGIVQLRARGPRGEAPAGASEPPTHLWLLGAVILYALLMPTIGYVAATFVFFAAAFRIMGTPGWKWPLGSAAVATAIFGFIFTWAADMPLPKGWFALG